MSFLFRLLEEYVGPTILTVAVLYFVVLFGCALEFSLEFVRLPFVERGVSTVIWISELHYLHLKSSVLPLFKHFLLGPSLCSLLYSSKNWAYVTNYHRRPRDLDVFLRAI